MLHGQSPPIPFNNAGIHYLSPPNPDSVTWYTQQAQNKMFNPQRASPPPSQSSPILDFNLDDDNLEPLWASASQLTSETTSQGNSNSSHIGLNLNDEAADSEDVNVQEVAPMGRDRAKKKASSSVARSETSIACDYSLVDALLKRELKLKDQKREELGELERLKIAQRDKELDLQQKNVRISTTTKNGRRTSSITVKIMSI
nr:hypothetical protein [Tanacetum cinerariifolium]